ncbi:hypothetical protein [Candidatus Nitrospira salsa]
MFEVSNCAGFVRMPQLERIWIRYSVRIIGVFYRKRDMSGPMAEV